MPYSIAMTVSKKQSGGRACENLMPGDEGEEDEEDSDTIEKYENINMKKVPKAAAKSIYKVKSNGVERKGEK